MLSLGFGHTGEKTGDRRRQRKELCRAEYSKELRISGEGGEINSKNYPKLQELHTDLYMYVYPTREAFLQ